MTTSINRASRTARLSLSDSMVLASSHTPDGRALDDTTRRVRAEVRAVATSIGSPIEVYACERHSGCLLFIVEPAEG